MDVAVAAVIFVVIISGKCLTSVSRSGSIVVFGDPIFVNVSSFGVVVAQGGVLGSTHFTEARVPKCAKVIKLPRRDAHAATPSANNNI